MFRKRTVTPAMHLGLRIKIKKVMKNMEVWLGPMSDVTCTLTV